MGATGHTVFDRVVMNVIQVSLQVVFIPDHVLPETSLPHAAISVANTRGRARSFFAATVEPVARKTSFDRGPTAGKVSVVYW